MRTIGKIILAILIIGFIARVLFGGELYEIFENPLYGVCGFIVIALWVSLANSDDKTK